VSERPFQLRMMMTTLGRDLLMMLLRDMVFSFSV
jgi:hypothetical protein